MLVDNREKTPYEFPCKTKQVKLEAGDYTVEGHEGKIAVERKSHGDIYRCLSSDLSRFKKQIRKLAKREVALVLIDTSLQAFLLGHFYSSLRGDEAYQRLLSLMVDFPNVHFMFVGNKGADVCLKILCLAVQRMKSQRK